MQPNLHPYFEKQLKYGRNDARQLEITKCSGGARGISPLRTIYTPNMWGEMDLSHQNFHYCLCWWRNSWFQSCRRWNMFLPRWIFGLTGKWEHSWQLLCAFGWQFPNAKSLPGFWKDVHGIPSTTDSTAFLFSLPRSRDCCSMFAVLQIKNLLLKYGVFELQLGVTAL